MPPRTIPLERSEAFLTPSEQTMLLHIARDSMTAAVRDGRPVDPFSYPLSPALQEKHGAFVTLRHGGELRGCIGSVAHQKAIAVSVSENAVNSATRDPRFAPVRNEEIEHIRIEISALTFGDTPETPFKRVQDIGEIVIGRDGLFVECPPRRGGLLLPQVAVERGWDVATFLCNVCRKAGYPDNAWQRPDARLFRFSAQVFGEEPD
ncbi:MAG: hypothetical protein AMXMBFR84_21140 [Candidatus Hydrogenedentota bacterium]